MKAITTEIVDEQERFDQKDSIFPRAVAGQETHKHIQRWVEVHTPDPIYRTLMGIPRSENCVTYHLVPAVDGPLNPEKVEIENPGAITEKVKGVAKFFGADMVGVCQLNPAYVASHRGDEYMVGQPGFGQVINLDHPYAISLGFKRDFDMVKAGHSFIDGGEGALVYNKAAVVACQLAAYIRELGYPAKAHHEREEEVLQIPIAVEAGLGELGRLGMLITREFGPRMRMSTVTTDLPLRPDEPVDLGVQKVCEICSKCADNCPSQAIPKGEKVVVRGARKWAIDPRKCLAFWGSNKEKWDDCSVCIVSCPYNRPDTWFNRAHHRPFFFKALQSPAFAKPLLWLDDLLRGKRPRYKVRWLDYRNYDG
jgi:ferredoxin